MIKGKAEKTIKSKEDCEESAVEGNKVEIACRMEEEDRKERVQWWKLMKLHRKQCCEE